MSGFWRLLPVRSVEWVSWLKRVDWSVLDAALTIRSVREFRTSCLMQSEEMG